MGIFSENRLSFIGEDIEYDNRLGSRFRGASGLMEYCNLLCERARLDEQISTILEAPEEANNSEENNESKDNNDSNKSTESKTEDNKNDLLDKILNLIHKISDAIEAAFKNATIKLAEITNHDESIIKKYSEAINNPKNLEGFVGVPNLPSIEELISVSDSCADSIEKVDSIFHEHLDRIFASKDKEEANSIVEEFNNKLSDEFEFLKDENKDKDKKSDEETDDEVDNSKYGTKGNGGLIPNANFIQDIEKALKNSKKVLSNLENQNSNAIKIINDIKRQTENVYRKADSNDFSAKSGYDITIKELNTISLICSRTIQSILKKYSTYRRIYITTGKYAYTKAHGGKQEQEEK